MRRDPKWASLEAFLKTLPKGGLVAELGVYHGKKTRVVYDALKPHQMIWVDWWAAYSNANQPQKFWDDAKKKAVTEFKKEIAQKKVIVHHCGLMTGYRRIADERLDFIRHDADEREGQVTSVLRAYWPKLKPGGIWMGHGFENRPPWSGTIPAVVKHIRENRDVEFLGLIAGNSHFVLRKAHK